MPANTPKKRARPTPKRAAPVSTEDRFPFVRENYKFMIIGLVVIAIGYLLMVGGRSPDPNEFYPEQVYSWRRITLAPIVIVLGFLVEVYAIMKKPAQKTHADQNTGAK